MTDKNELRRLMGQRELLHTDREREYYSEGIKLMLSELLMARPVETVMLYSPMANEPDLGDFYEVLAENGIKVLYPYTNKDRTITPVEYVKGCTAKDFAGITIPCDSSKVFEGDIDMVLVPGIAFNRLCNKRLGRGGGSYDRFLAGMDGCLKAGLCFPWQIVEDMPAEPHDAPVDIVLTGLEVY